MDLEQIESRCQQVSKSLNELADGKNFDELLQLIRKSGWTTVAEATLVTGLLDNMNAQAKQLGELKRNLLAGARAVGAK
jgi:hypothetical protein